MLSEFNLLASTMRGNERQMCFELAFLLKEVGDTDAKVDKTGIRGLVVAKTTLSPIEVIVKFRDILQKKPYEFRYALRIIPIEMVVPTRLEEIENAAIILAKRMEQDETFRVTVEKRFTELHSHDIIEAVASNLANKVDLNKPDKVLLIEVLGGFTGISLLEPSEVISVLKEKML